MAPCGLATILATLALVVFPLAAQEQVLVEGKELPRFQLLPVEGDQQWRKVNRQW